MVVPAHPHPHPYRSDDLFYFFFACQLVPLENENVILGEDFFFFFFFLGGGGLSAQIFSAPLRKTQGSPPPPVPTTGKILATPLDERLLFPGFIHWHLTLQFDLDPHNETDLLVFPCLPLLPNFIKIPHFILKLCIGMYIFSKIAVTFDPYLWPFTLVAISVYLTTYIQPFHQPKLWLDLQSQSYVSNNMFHNHILSERAQKYNLAS